MAVNTEKVKIKQDSLPYDEGNDLYLSNQLPWKIIEKIKFNLRCSKITELAGKGLHLVRRMLVFPPSRKPPVPWARQALGRKVQHFVDWTVVGWLLSILLCLVPLRTLRGR